MTTLAIHRVALLPGDGIGTEVVPPALRVLRYAFDLAASRDGRLVAATKSNGIVHTMPFWDEARHDVVKDYPSVDVSLRARERCPNVLHLRGVRPRDLGGDAGTEEVAATIADRFEHEEVA